MCPKVAYQPIIAGPFIASSDPRVWLSYNGRLQIAESPMIYVVCGAVVK